MSFQLSSDDILRIREKIRLQAPASSLFRGLDPDTLNALIEGSVLSRHEQGCLLIHQGDPAPGLYYIVEGAVKTFRQSTDGDEAVIRLIRPGDTFMDDVIFANGPSPVGVQTVSESLLLMIPLDSVKTCALKNGLFARNLLGIVAGHYKNAIQQIDGIITKPPLQRVGYYFLRLHLEQGGRDSVIQLPFRKSTISHHLGMEAETFSRVLHRLRTCGVETKESRIHLKELHALCPFCDPDMPPACPRYRDPKCRASHQRR